MEFDPCILFTSRFTGIPKGIALFPGGNINCLPSKMEYFGLESDVVLQQTSMDFDMAIVQAFNALPHAHTLIVAPQECLGDCVALVRLIAREKFLLTLTCPSE